jgi:hypothetical protein
VYKLALEFVSVDLRGGLLQGIVAADTNREPALGQAELLVVSSTT